MNSLIKVPQVKYNFESIVVKHLLRLIKKIKRIKYIRNQVKKAHLQFYMIFWFLDDSV